MQLKVLGILSISGVAVFNAITIGLIVFPVGVSSYSNRGGLSRIDG